MNWKTKQSILPIMDDLLIHSTKAEHLLLIEQLLQSMVKNGLRLSPKKCQLFKTNLVYMGNEFVISQKNITVTPLKSRTEAISKIPTPHTAMAVQKFLWCGELLGLVSSRLTNTVETHSSADKERNTFLMGQGARGSFPRSEV